MRITSAPPIIGVTKNISTKIGNIIKLIINVKTYVVEKRINSEITAIPLVLD